MKQIITAFANFEIIEPRVLKITINPIDPNSSEIEEYFKKIGEVLLKMESNFVVLLDGSQAKWISGKARIELGKGSRELEHKYKHIHKKTFFISPGTIAKMMLKAINIVSKPTVPQEVFSDNETALSALNKELSSW